MTAAENPRSTGELMGDILGNVASLVRNEADLARVEFAESMSRAGASLGAMAVAFALAMTGLNVLASSLVALTVWAGVPPHWATLAVGTALLLVALAIFSSARSALNQIGFVPTRAARTRRDAAAIRDLSNDQ